MAQVVENHRLDPAKVTDGNPHEGKCAGSLCPKCGCCVHCLDTGCGCDGYCTDSLCGCV